MEELRNERILTPNGRIEKWETNGNIDDKQ